MKKYKIFLTSIVISSLIFLSQAVSANPKVTIESSKSELSKSESSKSNKQAITTQVFKVNGMVCAFCAQGVEKSFKKIQQVDATKVDLDKMEITIVTRTSKGLTKEIIEETIKDSGYSFEGFVKNEEVN